MLKPVKDTELLFPHWNLVNSKETSVCNFLIVKRSWVERMSFWGEGRSSKPCKNYCEACLRIQTKLLGQIQKDIKGQVMWCITLIFRFLVSQTNSECCKGRVLYVKCMVEVYGSDWLWVSWRAAYHNSRKSSNWKATSFSLFSLLFGLPSIGFNPLLNVFTVTLSNS